MACSELPNKTEEEENVDVSLVSAIKDKYCAAPEPYYDSDVLHSKREIKMIAASNRPGAVPVQEVKIMILELAEISSVGPPDELRSMCKAAKELHLGGNTISSWETILSIIESIKSLKYLDLNHNNLLSQAPPPPSLPSPVSTSLTVLVLSCSCVPFEQVTAVLQSLPSIAELYLSKNEYTDDDLRLGHYPEHNGIKMLHLVSNDIKEWESAESVGKLFPSLETLIISENPLDNITPSGRYFKHLLNLNLNNTNISSWDSLEGLLTFSSLKSLSLWHVPIGSDLEEKDRRFAMISRLPSIELLNKSTISETEREDAERWLVRKYQSESKRPSVYEDLTTKHGELQPLPDIDLSPKKEVSLELVFEGVDRRSEVHSVVVKQTTKQFKSWIGNTLLKIHPSKLKLVYIDLEEGQVWDTHLMRPDSKPLHYYKMKDGDKIEVNACLD